MRIQIIGKITHIETIAVGNEIREFARLVKFYGRGRWRKRKGVASVRLADGTIVKAELHWYVLVHMIGDTFCLDQAPLVMGPSLTPAWISAVEPSKTQEKGPV